MNDKNLTRHLNRPVQTTVEGYCPHRSEHPTVNWKSGDNQCLGSRITPSTLTLLLFSAHLETVRNYFIHYALSIP